MILPSPITSIPREQAKRMSSRNTRKRRRPGGPLVVLVCALAANQSSGFMPVKKWTARREPYLYATTISEPTEKRGQQQVSNREGKEALERLFLLEEDEFEPKWNSQTTTTISNESQYPPWLQRYYPTESIGMPRFPIQELQDLEALLTRNGFSTEDTQDILQTIFCYYAPSGLTGLAKGDHESATSATALLMGMIDFVTLIVAEHSHYQTLESAEEETNTPMHCDVFASKPVILAGIAHYAECVAAREDGIYDQLERSLRSCSKPLPAKPLPAKACTPLLPGSELDLPQVEVEALKSSRPAKSRYPPNLPATSRTIAASAAKIKRAEILARTIMGVGSTRRLSKAEAEGLQGLLLSSMDDWRALALRCIASLFRLEGILHQQNKELLNQDRSLLTGLRSPEVVHTAQEAMLVYATLAQRLGMHQLKAKIEEKAFQILYQRQYKAVSSVYQQHVDAMQVIQSHLSSQIDAVLRSDESLMVHMERLEVSSRVKEPYSFWKKLLKTKAKQKKKLSLPAASSQSGGTSDLSFAQVQDGIALRVILKAKKESPDEPEETTRAREKLLCYYVQHLIRQQWPGDDDRLKDYIQYPKPNGYQSLHYTAWLTYYTGQHFPFEVQVRSEEMHRIAEYGVAAHWDYKLASGGGAASSQGEKKGAAFALKASDQSQEDEEADVTVEPEVVVDPLSLSFESVMKESPPAPIGNTQSPKTPFEVIDSKAAEKYSSKLYDNKQTSKGKNHQIEYIDALVTARQNLVQQRVYVFVAGSSSLTMDQGQLLILDSGSTIRDAFDYIKDDILQAVVKETVVGVGNNASARSGVEPSEPKIRRNGQPAQMDDIIRNGDVLLLEL